MPVIEAVVCRPQLFADPGFGDVKQRPRENILFHVVLIGASPGAYTSLPLVEARSDGLPVFRVEANCWHEVQHMWARFCIHKHSHGQRTPGSGLRWMHIRLAKPLQAPPDPPADFDVSPNKRIQAFIVPDWHVSGPASPASFVASEIGSDVPSFAATSLSSFVSQRSHSPPAHATFFPPSPPALFKATSLPRTQDAPSVASGERGESTTIGAQLRCVFAPRFDQPSVHRSDQTGV
uniref:Uncharacterized protein n=1 Tax=Mycena chlorophos TaxID=658473 RepID=A0ABQ0L5L4_MYCCL|nr:predicted protein [Mycena chlorophos]